MSPSIVQQPSHRPAAQAREMLFASPRLHAYAVVDAGACPALLDQIAVHHPEHVCLFAGHLSPEAVRKAPYLIRLERDSAVTDWLLSGWGQSWGIYVATTAALRPLRDHFRTFLMVLDPGGNPLFFRYYDPRVLGVYLPTVNEEESEYVFGSVEFYLFEEEETGAVLRCSRKKNAVLIERFDASES